ncbi:MAG: phage tail tube protein [Shewanella sp.]
MTVAYTGRDRLLSFSVCKPSDGDEPLATVAARTFLHVGGTRGKTKNASWDTADSTSSDSPQFNKEYLVTFKENTLSIDGIYILDAAGNLDALEDAIVFPDATNQESQPFMWLKFEHPQQVARYLFGIATSFERGEAYDGAATYSLEFQIMKELKGA